MPYNDLLIYFSSGTGNTFRAASWIAREAEHDGTETRVIPVEEAVPDAEIGEGSNSLFAVGAPAHGFCVPWHVLKFVLRLPRRKGTHALCFATRGSVKWGNFYLPGGSGSGIFLMALILRLKGYRVRGVFSIDMPLNWQNVFPPQKEKNTGAVINKAEPKTAAFTRRILSGGTYWLSLNNVYEFFLGLGMSWFTALYIYIGRPFMAKMFFASGRCNACGNCEQFCPVEGVAVKTLPYWNRHCESCMRCMAYCPEKAIEASHSYGLILFIAGWLPGSALCMPKLLELQGKLMGFESVLLIEAVLILIYPPFIYLCYYAIYFCSRVPWLNALLRRSTFTVLYDRYREPGTKIKKLKQGSN